MTRSATSSRRSATPRSATPRSTRPTYGAEAARVAELLGLTPTPVQRQILDVALEADEGGRLVYSSVVLSLPRRAGKTEIANVVRVWRMLRWPGQRLFMTAQNGLEAIAAYNELAERVEHSPLSREFTIRRGMSTSSMTCERTGSTLWPHAPLVKSLHGRAVDMSSIDEAWTVDPVRGHELLAAVKPAQATRVSPQLWVMSAAGTADSTWWAEWRARGEIDPRVAYFDYGIGEDDDPTDLELILAAHPASGTVLSMDGLRSAVDGLTPGEVRRAFGNIATMARTEPVIPAAAWEAAGTTATFPVGVRYSIGLDVDPERESAAVAVAARVGGHVLVEVLHAQRGVDWIVPVVQQLGDAADGSGTYDEALLAVVGDDAGPARSVLDELVRAGMDELTTTRQWGVLRRLTAGEWATACQVTYDLIVAGTLQHRRQDVLDQAVAAVARRPLGDGGWAWSRRKSGGPISALCALTAALAGLLDDTARDTESVAGDPD